MTSYGSKAYVNPGMPRIKSSTGNKTRPSMKRTFKQKLRNWLMDTDPEDYGQTPEIDSSGPSFDVDPLRINVYKASGGFVVETRKYDRRKDENITSMNIITEDKNLGEELGKIITLEALR